MSFIAYIQQKLADAAPLYLNDSTVVEAVGAYCDHLYCVTLNVMGLRKAYVEISPSHPLYDDDTAIGNLVVHGGVTFVGSPSSIVSQALRGHCGDEKWIGFDTVHHEDEWDLAAASRHFPDSPFKRWDLKEVLKYSPFAPELVEASIQWAFGTVKSTDYMAKECQQLIDQLCEVIGQ